jgi:carnitine O-acetyltransferase
MNLFSQRMSATVLKTRKAGLKSSAPASSSEVPPGYVADPSKGPMLRYQASLPRLPVPDIATTAEKYLETVRPHVSDAAFAKTESAVKEFVSSPMAAELQKRLQARAADPEMKNWLADWWNEAAYMGYRDPVVVFVSYFYVHLDDKLRRTSPKRAAALLKAMLTFRQMTERCVTLRSGSLQQANRHTQSTT